MRQRKTNPDFLNGVPELLILHLLTARPMHGYELVQAIRDASDGRLQFGEGCIYPVLHRLEQEKILVGRREIIGGRSRVVYRLTTTGKRRLSENSARWQEIVVAVASVLQGGGCGNPSLAGGTAS
jgi:PadR family transcriptional regulator PadR